MRDIGAGSAVTTQTGSIISRLNQRLCGDIGVFEKRVQGYSLVGWNIGLGTRRLETSRHVPGGLETAS